MNIFDKSDKGEKPAQEVIVQEETAVLPVVEVTPMQMIQMAVEKGQSLEQIEKLMELERVWKADRAREAFHLAVTQFKSQPVTVTKDRTNLQYQSKYTSIGNMVSTVNAAMAPFGLSARWDIDQSDNEITVTCILSHTLGHSESVPMSGLPDDSGKKNDLQKIKSTITYLKSATFEAVTGTVSIDSPDDDGNSADPVDKINGSQALDLDAKISETGASKPALLRYYKITSLEDMPAADFEGAIKALEDRQKQDDK